MIRLVINYEVHDGWTSFEGEGDTVEAALQQAFAEHHGGNFEEATNFEIDRYEADGRNLTWEAARAEGEARRALLGFAQFDDADAMAAAIRRYQDGAQARGRYAEQEAAVLRRVERLHLERLAETSAFWRARLAELDRATRR